MIDTSAPLLSDTALPQALVDNARQGLARYLERQGEEGAWLATRLAAPSFARQFTQVWGGSLFVADTCVTRPGLFRELVESGDLERSYGPEDYRNGLAAVLAAVAGEADLHRRLRQFRQREMVRILWRDFTRLAATLETTGDTTRLAEACIQGSLDFLQPLLAEGFGTPIGKTTGRAQQLVVIGMGKMGAYELNVSSDIDLIFTFPEGGETV